MLFVIHCNTIIQFENHLFVLLCDNLGAQVSTEFKQAIRGINGLVYFGPPGATDIWQPCDAGYGYVMKKLIAKAQNEWLESEQNFDLWSGKLSASDRRILITQWVGRAAEKLLSSEYDDFRFGCFEKTGIYF